MSFSLEPDWEQEDAATLSTGVLLQGLPVVSQASLGWFPSEPILGMTMMRMGI